ncbi:hypothetical protein GLOTRDRAFT_130545 [Gloeophyllum trabeum ATCC 11539]|uniref:Uncharacterized protein n=1 Tax=Gloeophyllum trabeum (strain ATCC 11539 / FP-39264 / Madison 617) TaxID=670483 RepID=S7Q3X5_GLOTA|nr:uncharacterized protein GLOTRDRAFT_130545 [Gloeophyllum trabeum ATCC 11539]EPQ54158.1 hypothetical protein GLOTRDRAFT_130545 [Gloeophyllum trabeum ATCC 11539]
MSVPLDFVQIKRKRKRPPARVSVDPCLGFYLTRADVEPTPGGLPDICVSLQSPAAIYSEVHSLSSAFDQEPGFSCVASPLPAIATLEDGEAQPSHDGGLKSAPTDDNEEDDMHRSPCLDESSESLSAASSSGFGPASILGDHRVIEHTRPLGQAICTPVTTTARVRRYHAHHKRLRGTQRSSQPCDSSNETINMDASSSSATRFAKRPRASWDSTSLGKVQGRRSSIRKKNKRKQSPHHQVKSLAKSMLTAAVLAHVDLPSKYLADYNLHRRPLKFTTDLDSMSAPPNQKIGQNIRPSACFRPPALRSSDFMYKRNSPSVKKVSMPMSHWSFHPTIESAEERAAGNSSHAKDDGQVRTSGPSTRVPLQFLPVMSDPDNRSRRDTHLAGRRKLTLSSVSLPRSAHVGFSPPADLKDVVITSDVGSEDTGIKVLDTDEESSGPISDTMSAPLSRTVENLHHQLDPLQHEPNNTEHDLQENARPAESAPRANSCTVANEQDPAAAGPGASLFLSSRQPAIPSSQIPNVPMPSTFKPLKPLASFFEEFMRTARALNETESPPKVQDKKRGRKRARKTDLCD